MRHKHPLEMPQKGKISIVTPRMSKSIIRTRSIGRSPACEKERHQHLFRVISSVLVGRLFSSDRIKIGHHLTEIARHRGHCTLVQAVRGFSVHFLKKLPFFAQIFSNMYFLRS